jgi:hypothetical protein
MYLDARFTCKNNFHCIPKSRLSMTRNFCLCLESFQFKSSSTVDDSLVNGSPDGSHVLHPVEVRLTRWKKLATKDV